MQPTIGNASELISCALEQHLDLIGKRENYVDYIANRPRVERVGEHGLFTDAGLVLCQEKVQVKRELFSKQFLPTTFLSVLIFLESIVLWLLALTPDFEAN